jgi:hypothetical protein
MPDKIRPDKATREATLESGTNNHNPEPTQLRQQRTKSTPDKEQGSETNARSPPKINTSPVP